MSVSCVGTCSACGVRRFWLSDTLSLQLDDASLECLPHPAERAACEAHGLTLSQASQRGRLYRETFYVCHECGRQGEVIEQLRAFEEFDPRYTRPHGTRRSSASPLLASPYQRASGFSGGRARSSPA